MRKIVNILKRLFTKRRYSSKQQRENRERKTIVEIVKKVIEEEEKTNAINDAVDAKMKALLEKAEKKNTTYRKTTTY